MSVPELVILGGRAANCELIPISQPTLPPFDLFSEHLRGVFDSRQLTNHVWVRRLEDAARSYLGCAEVVAVSSATAGLMLVARVLGLSGEVCLPSFTFPATLHALLWNGLKPRLVDCDPATFNLAPDSLADALGPETTGCVPVYIFGNSPDWDRLESMTGARSLTVFSDAAHALGTSWRGRMAGTFGRAEVFSLAPTKVTVAGEGGLVATSDMGLARDLRIARNYGNPGGYDCEFAGLNARLSEMHALLARLNLDRTEGAVADRHALAARYREGLGGLPGVSFQQIDQRCRTTYNYFSVRINGHVFGLSNQEVKAVLEAEGIESRIYFAPPLHRQTRFAHLFRGQGPFPGTDMLVDEVLCLPLYTHMRHEAVDRVVETLRTCRERSEEIRQVLSRRQS